MAEKTPDFNSHFYDALKNAQPLAFLASLSIVIAAFTYNIKDLPQVYPNAISGAFSFIFAFIFSIVSQILRDKDWSKLVFYLQLGTYFFLGVGILYLIFIATAFSEKITQIPQTFLAWSYGFIGIASTLSVWRDLKKIKMKKQLLFFDKLTLPVSVLIASAAWFATFAKLTSAIVGIQIDDKIILSIFTGGLATLGGFLLCRDIFLIIKRVLHKRK